MTMIVTIILITGGDDVQQLCEAGEEEFLEIMMLVDMASKPLHVRRLQKALQEWVQNPGKKNFILAKIFWSKQWTITMISDLMCPNFVPLSGTSSLSWLKLKLFYWTNWENYFTMRLPPQGDPIVLVLSLAAKYVPQRLREFCLVTRGETGSIFETRERL